jgi:TolB protein
MSLENGRSRLRRTLLVGIGLCMLGLIVAAPSQAAFPGANGLVVYDSNQGGSDLEIMKGPPDGSGSVQLTNNTVDDQEPAWSPNGTKIAWAHFNSASGHFEIWTMNADGTNQQALVTRPDLSVTDPTWSRDGSRVAFTYQTVSDHDIYRADTSGLNVNVTPVVNSTLAEEIEPSYAPNSNKIVFSRAASGGKYALYTVNDDGTSQAPLLTDATHNLNRPNWSPDGAKISYQYQFSPTDDDVSTVNANGTGAAFTFNSTNQERAPAWAPQGNMIAFVRVATDAEIYTGNPGSDQLPLESRPSTTENHPDWQPVVAAQVRAKGASPMYLPLVPAFNQCTVPNATHAMPFGAPSCSPPRETSSDLTVGEPAVNGKGANFAGSVKITALASGDARIAVSVTDVRCAHTFAGGCTGGPLSDYTGNMYLDYQFRITDRSNPAGTAGTMEDVLGINLNWPCTATADPTVGSGCPAVTTLNTLYPGLIVSGRRAVWRLRSLALKDANNNEFAVPGTFYP